MLPRPNKAKMTRYMSGWVCGAAFHAIPPEFSGDADFLAGWESGQVARGKAKTEAEMKYGEKFGVLTLQAVDGVTTN